MVECKKGHLHLNDFVRGKSQLEYSIEIVKNAFGFTPSYAVICHEGYASGSSIYLRGMLERASRLRHNVRLVLYKMRIAIYVVIVKRDKL